MCELFAKFTRPIASRIMTLLDICRTRESVRDFAPLPVEAEKLQAVLEAARLAPSACNRQPWKFFVLQSEAARAKAAELVAKFPWIAGAPVIIVCCIDHSQEWVRRYDGKPHGIVDIAIAAEHICLAAAEQGLGTCWVCSFDVSAFKAAFAKEFAAAQGTSVPALTHAESAAMINDLEPAVLIPLGYPAYDGPREKSRKALEEIVEVL